MPHRTVTRRQDGFANRDGALYAAWVAGKLPHTRLATDGIARDVLFVTGRQPLPLETTAILTAMARQEAGVELYMKLYLFGFISGVHKQRLNDRAAKQSRRQQVTEGFGQGHCTTAAKRSMKTFVADLRMLADRLDTEYHAAEAYESKVHREGHTGTDGSWHGDDAALAVARERMTLLRSVLGELEPILYHMEDEGAGNDA